MTCRGLLCQRQSGLSRRGQRLPGRSRISGIPGVASSPPGKNQLTRQSLSPTVSIIPSRVAEGLALRCHGNRFRKIRNDQVPIPGLKKISDTDGESVDLSTLATLGGIEDYYYPS
jgi:hypothetical protein